MVCKANSNTRQKQERLSRIRENQRQSRARKQEHTRELEQQLCELKKQMQQKDVDHRLAVQRLKAENQRLRGLLVSLGVDAGSDGTGEEDSVAARKIAIPMLHHRRQGSSCSKTLQSNYGPGYELPCTAENPTTEFSHSQSVCGCPSDDSSWPVDDDILNSTLCIIAEELISQYNTRGVDLAEIHRKLWAGFSRSATGDGCRVQNQVLFQVLNDISDF